MRGPEPDQNRSCKDLRGRHTPGGRRRRLAVRVLILIGAAVLAGGWGWSRGALVLPSLSPYLGLTAALALRRVTPWLLLGLPVLILAWRRGRWFCRTMCPTGLLVEGVSRGRPDTARRTRAIPKLGPWVLVVTLGGAAIGWPLFLYADPLALFNGFFGMWRRPVLWINLLPGLGLVALLLLCLIYPYAWCHRLCPLGAVQDGLYGFRRFRRTPAPERRRNGVGRRGFLGLLAGGVLAMTVRRLGAVPPVIRPPGAAPEDEFTGLCARCGNCMNACPEHIIRPDLGESGLVGLLSPHVRIGPGYCAEWCVACGQVCPTGAIQALSIKDKQKVSIGQATVNRPRCLAWTHQQYCMVCDEYCPYHAIKSIPQLGVNCPEVDSDICRGCGLCQTVCPAEQVAITVQGRAQRALDPVPM